MIREEYLRRLVDAAHVELYLSGEDGARIYWPWRMRPPKYASKRLRDACERFAVDSDPLDDTVTNRDVLDSAASIDAEVASLQDVYQDKDATVDSLLKGLEVADDHEFDGTLLLPLQKPYVECYREIGEPTDHWVGLGGLKDATNMDRIRLAREFDTETGGELHVHGFGWGPNDDLSAAVRQTPSMLDSLDYSSPLRQTATQMGATPGDEIMSVTAAYAASRLIRDLREVSPFPDKNEAVGVQGAMTDFTG